MYLMLQYTTYNIQYTTCTSVSLKTITDPTKNKKVSNFQKLIQILLYLLINSESQVN